MLRVELDDLRQALHRSVGSQVAKVGIQVRLELVEQHLELGVIELPGGRDVSRINQDRAVLLEDSERRVGQLIRGRTVAKELLSRHADPRALQCSGVEKA